MLPFIHFFSSFLFPAFFGLRGPISSLNDSVCGRAPSFLTAPCVPVHMCVSHARMVCYSSSVGASNGKFWCVRSAVVVAQKNKGEFVPHNGPWEGGGATVQHLLGLRRDWMGAGFLCNGRMLHARNGWKVGFVWHLWHNCEYLGKILLYCTVCNITLMYKYERRSYCSDYLLLFSQGYWIQQTKQFNKYVTILSCA